MNATAEMKRETLARLRAYRAAHGLGCLARLSKATRSKVTENQLRDMLSGYRPAELRDWQAVARALDRLEGGTEQC